ncbi:MAG: DUF6434 domain-containing protein [Bacteroidota bacterium]
MLQEQRPDIYDIKSGKELQRWYWLKAELVAHCQALEIPYTGSKLTITERLAHFLDTGKIAQPKRWRAQSSFNWARAELQPDTMITDSYRNGPNVRRFFSEHIGPRFRFNIAFMQWMKTNVGKTLADAVDAWEAIEQEQKTAGFKSKIPASNQYNQYLRDFFAANPKRSMKEARKCWAKKTEGPAPHRYDVADLLFLQQKT